MINSSLKKRMTNRLAAVFNIHYPHENCEAKTNDNSREN